MLESGKHVLCEKPLGMNVKETQEMVNLAQKQKLFLMEAVWSRCLPSYAKVQELLAQGIIPLTRSRNFSMINVEYKSVFVKA